MRREKESQKGGRAEKRFNKRWEKIIPGFIQLISLCPIWAYTLGFKKKVERLRRGTQRTKMGSYGGEEVWGCWQWAPKLGKLISVKHTWYAIFYLFSCLWDESSHMPCRGCQSQLVRFRLLYHPKTLSGSVLFRIWTVSYASTQAENQMPRK